VTAEDDPADAVDEADRRLEVHDAFGALGDRVRARLGEAGARAEEARARGEAPARLKEELARLQQAQAAAADFSKTYGMVDKILRHPSANDTMWREALHRLADQGNPDVRSALDILVERDPWWRREGL
jgi:hypothetical protein